MIRVMAIVMIMKATRHYALIFRFHLSYLQDFRSADGADFARENESSALEAM
jgi:hypothetical protein